MYYSVMAYSEDLRQRVRNYIANGGSPTEASFLFCVGRTTIYYWLKDNSPSKKAGRKGPDKIETSTLLNDVRKHPDKLLRERAELFGVTAAGICRALKRLGIKKNAEI